MTICRLNLLSFRGAQRAVYQLCCTRSYQLSRLVITILLIQALAGLWLVYRLKQPHKRVRSLIKHPYHLFSKSQFKQTAEELPCSPDSQEQEASLFSKISKASLEHDRAHYCTHCRKGLARGKSSGSHSTNISHWKKMMVEHRNFQQSLCEGDGNAPRAAMLNTTSGDALESIALGVLSYIAALLTNRPFFISAPLAIARETHLVHRYLDWRPMASECATEDSVYIQQASCREIMAAVGLNATLLAGSHEAPDLGLKCVAELLQSVQKGKVSSAEAHAVFSEAFRFVFTFPLEILGSVNDFLGHLRRKAFSAIPQSNSTSPNTSRSHSSQSAGVVCFSMNPAMTSVSSSLWRCARLLGEVAVGEQGRTRWLLMGGNQTQLSALAKDAARYLLCSGKQIRERHAISTWAPPFSPTDSFGQLSQLYLLSQCTAHITANSSALSKLASAIAGHKYMFVRSEKAQKKSTERSLQDTCQLDLGM